MESLSTYTFPLIGYGDVIFAARGENIVSASLLVEGRVVSRVQRGVGIEQLDSDRVYLNFLDRPLRAGLLNSATVTIECSAGEVPSLEIGEAVCEPLVGRSERVVVGTELGLCESEIRY